MGLLTILSRRSGKGQSREDMLRSQQVTPLQRSLQTSRPVSVSISGTRITPGHSETQFSEASPNQANEFNGPQPPFTPAFRVLLDNSRPGSADSFRSRNSDQPRVLQRPRREARRPPLSFRNPSSLSTQTIIAAEQHSPQLGGPDSEIVPSRESRQRSGSMSSLARRQSKDLLDAVDEFRPLDFRSRVQAAGTRDYGEDVADRNIRLSTTISSPNLYSRFRSDRSFSLSSMNANGHTKSISSVNDSYGSTPREVSAQADFDGPEFFSRRNKNRLSLTTYKPSGLVSPSLDTPWSSVTTTGGHHGGMTPSDFDSPAVDLDIWSRPSHMSPTVSNFSLPRSPLPIRHPTEIYDLPSEETNVENSFPEELEFGDIIPSNHSSQRRSTASDAHGSSKTTARFSQGTFRSSLASSVTSRYSTMDFMPLGYPRLQGQSKTDFDNQSNNDDVPMWRSQSLRSHRHTRSNSSGNAQSQQRTRSLLSKPTGLTNLVEADTRTNSQPHSSNTHDWALTMSSNGSASSSSNGIYSGTSGSMRPASRHTKATSIDSIPRPPSSSSALSASIGQSTNGWSPSTTRSTGFNIDDYVSSDDDSFTTKKRPSGEGEEELLFKDGYGVTGASLPGLLQSMIASGPPRFVGTRQLRIEEEEAKTEDDDDDAAEAPDIDDIRLSEKRDLPSTQLRYVQGNGINDQFRTFGRQSVRPRAHSSTAPSWLPSDDWAHVAQIKRTATPSSSTLSATGIGVYEETRPQPSRRGQTRLSALGPLPGSSTTDSEGGGGVKRANSMRELDASLVKEEGDPAIALRLRKEAKARKREDEAKTIREKRMTRAFGHVDEEGLAAQLQAQSEGEMETRGRTRVRGMKGKSVVPS